MKKSFKTLSFLRPSVQWLLVILFLYFGWVLWTLYLSGHFFYHDLTLLSDVFANTAYGRGFFHVTEFGYSHFKLQFTPTLLVLVPFFRLFESQFTLLAIGLVAYFCAAYLFLKLAEEISERALDLQAFNCLPTVIRWALPISLLLLLSVNRYSKNTLTSGHYEVLLFPFAAFLLWQLQRGTSRNLCLLATLLICGMRSDASFYLFFQLVALFFVPDWIWAKPSQTKKTLTLLCTVVAIYFLTLMFVINPQLKGIDPITRWWGHLGSTPSEIVLSIIRSPEMVIREIFKSGFLAFNVSFFFLPILLPRYFFLINLPAIPLYLLQFNDRKNLFCYQSAPFIPFHFLGALIGILIILRWSMDRNTTKPVYAVLGLICLAQLLTFPDTNNGYKFLPHKATQRQTKTTIQNFLTQHPEYKKVATDFLSLIFLPNSRVPILLDRYENADLVILNRRGDPRLSGKVSLELVENALFHDPRYSLLHSNDELLFFSRNKSP